MVGQKYTVVIKIAVIYNADGNLILLLDSL